MSLPDMVDHQQILCRRGGEVIKRLSGIDTPVGVEVGVYRGALAACVLRELPGLTWYMVDRWAPPPRGSSYAQSGDSVSRLGSTAFDEVYCDAIARTSFADDRRVICRGDSTVQAELIAPKSIDLVFIDGDHSDQGVTDDLVAWHDRVKPGGWLGGHDWRPAGRTTGWHVGPAVMRWFNSIGVEPEVELGVDKTWWIRRVGW